MSEPMQFDRYYRYKDLTTYLNSWAEQYSHICQLHSLGESYEGRDIWIMVLTNFETGPDNEKPAY